MARLEKGFCVDCIKQSEMLGVFPAEKYLVKKHPPTCDYHNKMRKEIKNFQSGKTQLNQEKKKEKAKELYRKMIFKASDLPIPAGKTKAGKRKPTGEAEIFKQIWKEREHICINCKDFLGNEPLAHFFSHRKSKGAHPELRLDKNNIDLLCRDCHYARDFQGEEKFKKRTR